MEGGVEGWERESAPLLIWRAYCGNRGALVSLELGAVGGCGVISVIVVVEAAWRAGWGKRRVRVSGRHQGEVFERRHGGQGNYGDLSSWRRVGISANAFALADQANVIFVVVWSSSELDHGIGMRRQAIVFG